MSVLIKGMEMPDMCSECDFCGGLICPDNIYCCDCPSDAIYGKNITRAIEEDCRHPDCPLVPVPPHGDLIDRDALRQSIKESIDECHKWADEVEGGEMYARVSQALGTFVECSLRVKAAPTIIPAEEAPAEDTNVPTTYDLLYEEGGPNTT